MKPTDILRKTFLDYHQRHQRQIKNRDKALILGRYGLWRDRWYLHPTKAELIAKPHPHYEPAEDTAWEFVLYRTAIVTVYPDQTAELNDGGWPSTLTYDHMEHAVPRIRIGSEKPNAWTDRYKTVNSITPYFNGLRLDLENHTILNPKPMYAVKPDFNNPKIKEARAMLRKVRETYAPYAVLHTASRKNKINPFEGVAPVQADLETLATSEPTAELYVGLVGVSWWRYWQTPEYKLRIALNRMKRQEYSKYLVEVK